MRVRSLTCGNCGGRARIPHGEQEAVCIHCGNPVRLSEAVLQEQEAARQFPPTTPLRLGMKAQWGGREYELTGRQCFTQISDGIYKWEEFVLVAPDGHLLYLEFDEGKWKLSEPFTPLHPLGPAELQHLGEGASITLDHSGALVTDSGDCILSHAEGEFPYVVTPGSGRYFLDAAGTEGFYSVEWTEDAVEYYKGRYLDLRQVYTMFDLRDELRRLDSRERALRSRRRFGATCVVLSLVSLIWWIVCMAAPGRLIPGAFGTVSLAEVPPEGKRFGPFELRAVGKIHRLELRGSLREESHWIQAVLEDEAEVELLGPDREMWDESGYDSDGYWHESDLHASKDFVLRKAGKYYVRLNVESEPGRVPSPLASASFALREGVLHPTWPGWFGLATMILGVVFLIAGSQGTRTAIAQAMQSNDD